MIEEKNEKIIPLTRNFMFIQVFYYHDGIKRLEKFLADYLGYNYSEVKGKIELIPREQEQDFKMNAQTQVDLIFKYNDITYDIEMNGQDYNGLEERNLVYISKVIGSKYKKNMKYEEISGAKLIDINNYRSNETRLIKKYQLISIDDDPREYGNGNLRVDVIDLTKVNNTNYKPKSEQEKRMINWCRLFTCENIVDFEKICDKIFSKEESERFVELMGKLSSDEEIIRLEDDEEMILNGMKDYYKDYYKDLYKDLYKEEGIKEGKEEGFKEGREQGIEQGIEQGALQNKIETAKNLLKLNVDKDIIIKATGLSIEEIENLE